MGRRLVVGAVVFWYGWDYFKTSRKMGYKRFFLSAYAGLEAVRNIWLGWTLDVFLHRLMSGSLLLFTLFMLTDPRSIPSAKSGRYVWVICIAVLTSVLQN